MYSYASSKAALHQLTRVLARELGPQHITVNAVAPGPFPSKMMAATLDAFGDSIAASAPLRRIGRDDDMAGIAVFLASRAGCLPHRRGHPRRRRHRDDRQRLTWPPSEQRDGVDLTNLDEPLTPDAGATKRDLVDYLDAVADRMLPGLVERPLTVLRVLRGREPFMQKNVPKYTPDWVRTAPMWAEASHREVHYALCNDRRTLLWLANQRAVEYHPTLGLADDIYRPTHLVLDLDPPDDDFAKVVAVAHLVRQALADSGLAGAVKTSGAKGMHVFVPIDDAAPVDDVAAATRALAARAEALDPDDRDDGVHRRRPRRQGVRRLHPCRRSHRRGGLQPPAAPGHPGVVSAGMVRAGHGSPRRLHGPHGAGCARRPADAGRESMPQPQRLPTELIEHGRTIPVARVAAMHEGKRRARARRQSP